jgi:hypothetical protein
MGSQTAVKAEDMSDAEFKQRLADLIDHYLRNKISLSSLITNIEGLAFIFGGEELFATVEATLSQLADIDAHSSEKNYVLNEDEKIEVKDCLRKLRR